MGAWVGVIGGTTTIPPFTRLGFGDRPSIRPHCNARVCPGQVSEELRRPKAGERGGEATDDAIIVGRRMR